MTAIGRVLLATALAATFVSALVPPGLAHAHGVLRRSSPASDARLDTVPREIRLVFNEPVELAVARIALRDADGTLVALGAVAHGDSATAIVAQVLAALHEGRWTVEWQVAGRDGHPVRGSYRFTILAGAAGIGSASAAIAGAPAVAAGGDASHDGEQHGAEHRDALHSTPQRGFDAGSPPFAAVRWLGYVGLLVLIGTACFALVVLPRARRSVPALAFAADRAPRFAAGAVVLLLVAALLRLVAQSVATSGLAEAFVPARLGALVAGTGWGRAWLLQLAGIALAGAGVRLATRRGRAGWPLAAAGSVVAAIALGLSGHAAAVPRVAALAVASDALHVLAAGAWLGTLLVVAVVGIRSSLRAEPAERGPAAAALVEAFSPLALGAAGLLVATGVASSWMHLDALPSLWTSPYGRTLLVKLALLSLVLGTGAYNWRRVRPALGDERGANRILRSSTVELAVAALVLAATAVLTATPTAADAARLAAESQPAFTNGIPNDP